MVSVASSPPTQGSLPFHRNLLRPGDRICVAVSGGADSVALFRALHAANSAVRDALGVGLSVAHVHHGIRGEEADEDFEFVRQICARLEIPLHVHRADVPALAESTREGLEETARNVRYGFFRDLLQTGEADAVLTAHTLDDQAETVMMKLLRGAWTEGLSAIHPVVEVPGVLGKHPGRILRPLLATSRAEVLAYLQAIHQPWREDPSNADWSFTRNRVRHQLMPILRDLNPSAAENLAHVAELAREDEARWQGEVGRLLPQILLPGKPVRGGGRAVGTAPGDAEVSIELDRLRSMDPALRRRILRAAAREIGTRLSFDDTSRLLELAGFSPLAQVGSGLGSGGGSGLGSGGSVRLPDRQPGTRPGAVLHLPDGLRAERSLREIRLFRANTPAALQSKLAGLPVPVR